MTHVDQPPAYDPTTAAPAASTVFLDTPPEGAPVVVFLIEQEGCPACEEFHPIFEQVAAAYAAQGLPIVRVNAATEDPAWQQWMGWHRVVYTPTVLAVAIGRGVLGKIEGGGNPVETQMLLMRATMVDRQLRAPQLPRPWWAWGSTWGR